MRCTPAYLIAAGVLCAAVSGAQTPGLTHWRVVRNGADSVAIPRVTASVGYLTMGGMRRVDLSFASDTDAYALVAHVAADGTLRIVFPATPRGTGLVHAGDTIVVPTFLGGRDSVVVNAKNASKTTSRAAPDSYDGGASYLFIIASTSPLHMQGMLDGARWATLALDRRELADPRPAIDELARTFGAGETYSLTYVHAKDEISTVSGGHRVGPATQATFREMPLSQSFDVSAPPPPYLLAYTTYQWFDLGAPMPSTSDAYADGYTYGYEDGLLSGGWFRGSHFFGGRHDRQGFPCSGLNSNAGLFAPGFPAFGAPPCGNVMAKYTPAVGLRADQLPSASKARAVAPVAAAPRMSAEVQGGTTVFMKAPLGGPIPYQGTAAAAYSGSSAAIHGASVSQQVTAPVVWMRGYAPYGRAETYVVPSNGGYMSRGGAAAVSGNSGQMRAVTPRQGGTARAVPPPVKHQN